MAAYDASSTNKSKKTVRSFYKDLDLDFTRNVVTNDVVKIKIRGRFFDFLFSPIVNAVYLLFSSVFVKSRIRC